MKKNTIAGMAAGVILLFSLSAWSRVPQGSLLDGVAPGPDGRIDILTVFSHQDDESIYAGGAVLKALLDPRVRLHILCLTFDQTSGAKDVLGITPDHIGKIRVKELETAAAVYGAEEVIQFEYPSRTLGQIAPEELVRRIGEVIERAGAEIVLTHDPVGYTGHWDHVACSRVATEAFRRSGAQALFYPTLPRYLYRPLILFSDYEFEARPARPTLKVDIRAEKKLKHMACAAHASQMQFTGVGNLTRWVLLLDREYFTRIDQSQ